MQVDMNLVKRARIAFKYWTKNARDVRKSLGIHPATSDAEAIPSNISANLDNYAVQCNMSASNPYAEEYAVKAHAKLIEHLDFLDTKIITE